MRLLLFAHAGVTMAAVSLLLTRLRRVTGDVSRPTRRWVALWQYPAMVSSGEALVSALYIARALGLANVVLLSSLLLST